MILQRGVYSITSIVYEQYFIFVSLISRSYEYFQSPSSNIDPSFCYTKYTLDKKIYNNKNALNIVDSPLFNFRFAAVLPFREDFFFLFSFVKLVISLNQIESVILLILFFIPIILLFDITK